MTIPDLTIKGVTARAVLAPLPRPITTANAFIPAAPLVLIDLDFGDVTGHAYLFGYTPLTLKPLVAFIDNLNDVIAGQPLAPRALHAHLSATVRLLGRQGLVGMAIAGLDMAAWDALGKASGLSVARLLGAAETPVPCYDSHGVFNRDTAPGEIETSLKQGFKAVKFKIGGGSLAEDIAVVRRIRDQVGPNIRVMVDYNQSLDAPEAIRRISALSQFDLDWVEEPVPAEDFAGHAAIRAAVSTPIQTGENWWFPDGAANTIAAGVSDHAMPDIMKIGGFTGWLEAAALAHAASLPVSSHLFIEASSHALAATPGACLLEYMDVAGGILEEPYRIKNGTLTPRGPGLGIAWDEGAVSGCLV